MNSHSNSRNSPTLGSCQRERHSGVPSAASALSAGQLLREGRLMRSAQELRAADHQSRITIHQPPVPDFLIASHQLLEIRVTCSQQTRKYFLIASFYRVLAHSRLLATPTPPASHRISKWRHRVGDSRQLAGNGSPKSHRDSLRLRIRRTSAKLGPCENYPTLR
jgi:hypothetical protein